MCAGRNEKSTRKNKELWLEDLEYSFTNAKDLYEAKFYDMAMLCTQLAVEKALKAEGMHPFDRSGMLLDLWVYIEELNILTYTPKEFKSVKKRFRMQKILEYAKDITPTRKPASPT